MADNKEKYLNQLFDEGKAWDTFEIIEGKLEVTLTTLTAAQQSAIDEIMYGQKGTQTRVLRTYALAVLQRSIQSWGGIEYTEKELEEKLLNQSSLILEKLIRKQRGLEKEVSEYLGLESVKENFSLRDGQTSESGPSPVE